MRSSSARMIAIAAAFLAFGEPAVAEARAPVLIEVGRIGNQPTARWSLPAGVRASRLVAFDAPPGAGGTEVFSTYSIYPTYFAPQTERLRAGTYWFAVAGKDTRCGTCPTEELSNALRLVIPAFAPKVSIGSFTLRRLARSGSAVLHACHVDYESAASYRPTVLIVQSRVRGGRVTARVKTTIAATITDEWGGGCGPLAVGWKVSIGLNRGDTYRISFTVVNEGSPRSRTLTLNRRW
jgi:hypothetical protein